ncbi:hypothetical protein AX16_009777 [Volvariella volvacea WC 439]|nr:hypothetical protein AX16_009777 [Volvariella volvacea WC 439]
MAITNATSPSAPEISPASHSSTPTVVYTPPRNDEHTAPSPPRSPTPSALPLPHGMASPRNATQLYLPGSASAAASTSQLHQVHHQHNGIAHNRTESALTYRDSFEANYLAPGRLSIHGNPSVFRLRPQKSFAAVKLNPTNYVSLSRKTVPQKRFFLYRASASISGSFAVNPYLHIPTELLPPSPEKEVERKNLRLEVENGGIDVDIILVGDSSPMEDVPPLLTTLDLKLSGRYLNRFPLIARLHTPNLVRPPFHLMATSLDGYVSIHLPPSFHGPVMVRVNSCIDLGAHISLSHAFKENSFILSEADTARCYFVGEVGGWSKSESSWKGDRVDIYVNSGKVRFQMLGEKDWDMIRKFTWKLV